MDDINDKITTTPAEDKSADFLNLEELIKNYISKIDQIKEDLKNQKQILDDALEGDAVYREHSDKAKEANRIKSATKQQILKQPVLMEVDEKIRDMKFDIQEQEAMLNDYLQQYQKIVGVNQITLENGEILEIVNVCKVVRKRKSE